MRELTLEKSHLPAGSLEGAVEFLRRLHWHLNVKQADGFLYLLKGKTVVLKTDSKDVVDAFIYGAALAYCSLPEPVLAGYRDYLLRHFGEPKAIPALDSGL
jgi:hypothetical protein